MTRRSPAIVAAAGSSSSNASACSGCSAANARASTQLSRMEPVDEPVDQLGEHGVGLQLPGRPGDTIEAHRGSSRKVCIAPDARMCRTLAAPSLMPRAVAICAIERASICRIARSLRSALGQASHRGPDALAVLVADRPAAWAGSPGNGTLARRRTPAMRGRSGERPLAIDASLARAEVMPMKLGQTFQGELTEPRQQRKRRILQVVPKAAGRRLPAPPG